MALFPTFGNQVMPGLRDNSDLLLQTGLGLLGGRTAQEQVAGAAQGIAGARQQNKTVALLRANGANDLADAVESGATTGSNAFTLFQQRKLAAEKPRNNFMSAGGSLYNTETGQWISPPAGSGNDAEYGLQPVYGTDPKTGQTRLGQISKNGTFKVLDTGDNFQVSTGTGTVDLGTSIGTIDKRTGQVISQTPKDLAGAESEKAVGKAQGDAIASYRSMESKMPGLESVVKKLDGLSEKATYTLGGQMVDLGRKQLGLDPREGALARSEYIATVDNQVLPLLRDTFGAAFTQKEGDGLRATLGDPDKTPQEKQVVLRAFIEQKRRDVAAMAAQAGQPQPAPTQQRLRFNPQTGELE